jgi:hypothetical protein
MNNVIYKNLPNEILMIILSKMDKYKGLKISMNPENEIVISFENQSRLYSPIYDIHLEWDNESRFINQYYREILPYENPVFQGWGYLCGVDPFKYY